MSHSINKRYIALDTKTTGISIGDNHRIIEIGCVEIDSNGKEINTFHRYIDPERDIPLEAQKVHGITLEKLKAENALPFEDTVTDFLKFVHKSTLIIHNASFDMTFLEYEISQLSEATKNILLQHKDNDNNLSPLTLPDRKNNVIDTLLLSKGLFDKGRHSLDALCKRYNISLETREKHGALIDSRLLAQVYIELITNNNQGNSLGLKNNNNDLI